MAYGVHAEQLSNRRTDPGRDQMKSIAVEPFVERIGRSDQRAHPRLATRMRVDFVALEADADGVDLTSPKFGVARDISERGLLLGRTGFLPVGSLLHLFLRLPDLPANPIGVYARVLRCHVDDDGVGYGLRFLRCRERDRRRLRRYVGEQLRYRQPRPDEPSA